MPKMVPIALLVVALFTPSPIMMTSAAPTTITDFRLRLHRPSPPPMKEPVVGFAAPDASSPSSTPTYRKPRSGLTASLNAQRVSEVSEIEGTQHGQNLYARYQEMHPRWTDNKRVYLSPSFPRHNRNLFVLDEPQSQPQQPAPLPQQKETTRVLKLSPIVEGNTPILSSFISSDSESFDEDIGYDSDDEVEVQQPMQSSQSRKGFSAFQTSRPISIKHSNSNTPCGSLESSRNGRTLDCTRTFGHRASSSALLRESSSGVLRKDGSSQSLRRNSGSWQQLQKDSSSSTLARTSSSLPAASSSSQLSSADMEKVQPLPIKEKKQSLLTRLCKSFSLPVKSTQDGPESTDGLTTSTSDPMISTAMTDSGMTLLDDSELERESIQAQIAEEEYIEAWERMRERSNPWL